MSARRLLPSPAAARVLGLVLLLAVVPDARADDQGPYFDPDALPKAGYELRTTAAFHYATRTDFTTPVFLFAQPLRSIEARELSAELDLRVSLSPSLAIQASAPLVYRELDATLDAVVIDAGQVLAPQRLALTGLGAGDAALGLAYRVRLSDGVAAFVDAGSRVPLDDNPGSNVLPERVPAGAGQNALYLGLGANLKLDAFAASLAYRIEYALGNSATYLVRRIGNQGYTSGSLGPHLAHRVTLSARYAFATWLALAATPEWRYAELPTLVTSDGAFRFRDEPGLHELTAQLALRFTPHPSHVLVLGWTQPFLEVEHEDPFFPLVMPARGPSLSWHVIGY